MDCRVEPGNDGSKIGAYAYGNDDPQLIGYCCAVKSTAVRVTRRSRIITAPMITMTRRVHRR